MISAIVFSKDRALQLDLTLSSIKRNFKQASEVLVIFQTSTEHVQSYQILQKEYPDTHFISQSKEGNGGLFGDIEKAISNARQEYICFFTDYLFFYILGIFLHISHFFLHIRYFFTD